MENLEDLPMELGCRVGELPSTYLGLPLGMRHNSMEEAVHIQRGKTNPYKKHSNEYASLHHVPVLDA